MARDSRGLGWLGKIFVLVIIAGVYAGATTALFLRPSPSPYTPPIAETGDFVEVDYRGWFPDNLRTFDTSIEAVAKDNATYPKAASFTYRIGGAQYNPLQFALGCSGGSGCPLKSFQNAALRLHVGESRTVTLQPMDAYGLSDPAKLHVRPLLEDIVATVTMNTAEFEKTYAIPPADGLVVTDFTSGWNVTVHVAGDSITTRGSPTIGQVVTVAGKWRATVVSIDDSANQGLGAIRVRHALTTEDVRRFVAVDTTGNFVIDEVDPVAGTFTTNYNNEVVGRPLEFQITLVTLKKAIP